MIGDVQTNYHHYDFSFEFTHLAVHEDVLS